MARIRGEKLLSDGKIKAAKPKHKPYKLSDGGGLVLVVMPDGGRLWRLRFTHPTKMRAPTDGEIARAAAKGKTAPPRRPESMVALGTYPATSLKDARDKADNARVMLEGNKSPVEVKRADRHGETFEAVALTWLAKQPLAHNTHERTLHIFKHWLFGRIGGKPIAMLTSKDVIDAVVKIGDAGKYETARRALQRIGSVLRFAKARHMVPVNVAADIKPMDLLGSRGKTRHHAGITDPVRIGELLRAIDGYQGAAVTRHALQLAPLVFTRPGERRQAEWAQVDLDSATPTWKILADNMKMRREHIVPLSRQAVAILRDLKRLTGSGKYLFPAMTTGTRPLSENTENTAIRRLGYTRDEMTAHGFRTMASTRLNAGLERKGNGGKYRPNRDWIEMQLAHSEDDSSRADYNAALYEDERREMMQAWADYLDTLRAMPAKAAA